MNEWMRDLKKGRLLRSDDTADATPRNKRPRVGAPGIILRQIRRRPLAMCLVLEVQGDPTGGFRLLLRRFLGQTHYSSPERGYLAGPEEPADQENSLTR